MRKVYLVRRMWGKGAIDNWGVFTSRKKAVSAVNKISHPDIQFEITVMGLN
ncbi:MAG TPA: hypothetical protein PK210_05105 [Bacteroidia bacterium]|nr:hypothetical protein [Bacteroidia bacterium]